MIPLDHPQNHGPVLIVGTGALACLFAGRLAEAGVGVVMLGGWAEGLRALRGQGVRLVDPEGDERAFAVQVADSPEACGPVKYALVLVKSWQTARAARQLAACLAQDGLALTLQNGYGNRERLAEALGEARVALGVTTVGATLLGPGRVRQAGVGRISLGESPSLGQLPGWLEAAGFELSYVADTEALLWGKLVVNAAINPLTGLLRVPNGELLRRTPARELMGAAAGEAAGVVRAMGVQLPYADPVALVEAVARDTADNHSSMLQDLERGAPTEIDAICGAVVGAGERLGVPAPVNRCLWQLVRALEMEGA
jgi:2-dehydropantoate 2-reductase